MGKLWWGRRTRTSQCFTVQYRDGPASEESARIRMSEVMAISKNAINSVNCFRLRTVPNCNPNHQRHYREFYSIAITTGRLVFPSHTTIMFSLRSIARTPIALRTATRRPLSTSTRFSFPRKDNQDKDSINTESTEYSKTGGDQQSAHSKAAFDPNTTDPDQQVNEAEGVSF